MAGVEFENWALKSERDHRITDLAETAEEQAPTSR
jgi:hypothetical protein